jgi:serine/threonine protein kinase
MGRQGCPNDEELSAFQAGNMPNESFESLAQHVESCADCLAILEQLAPSGDSLLDALGVPVPTDEFTQETKCREAVGRLAAVMPKAVSSDEGLVLGGNPPSGCSPEATTLDEKASAQERDRPARERLLPQVPGYVVVRWIGGGGMGDVFEAINRLGIRFALKVIRSDLSGPELRARFRKEATALQGLDHPNVARIFEYNEVDGVPFFTMRLLTGGTLAARSAEYRSDPHRAVALMATVAGAVGYLHRRNFLHRDLKPSNILFDEEGRPCLSDFGLVKDLTPQEAEALQDESEAGTGAPFAGPWPGLARESLLTATGWVAGTLQYMSPEQVRGEQERVGPWSDVWALGVILYELLTGSRPFQAADKQRLTAQIETAEPPAPRQIHPGLDEMVEAIVLKCLAKRPEDRYPSATALAEALRGWEKPAIVPSQDKPATGPLDPRRTRRKYFARLAGVLVVVAALVVGIGLAVRPAQLTVADAQAKLAHLEAVELIGRSGLPNYNYANVLTGPETNVYQDPEGVLAIAAPMLGLVEILPDPMLDSYRFRLAVRQDTWLTPASRAGLYCLHQVSENERGKQHHLVELGVMEDDVTLKVSEPQEAGGPPRRDENRRLTSVACFLRVDGKALIDKGQKQWGLLVFETDRPNPGGAEPWRELVIEVTPEQVRAFHGNRPLGQPLDRRREKGTWSWLSTRPRAPRGGLGLYVFGGSASFRFGAIEPLQDHK